jgi:hypothetical protein
MTEDPHKPQHSESEPGERRMSISFEQNSEEESRGSDSPQSLDLPLLVREDDEEEDELLLFPQFDDSEMEMDEQDYYIPHDQKPLSPGRVILLLSAPSLRLGAFAIPYIISSNLTVSILCLLIASLLALFVRHLWVILAYYVRKVTVEDILLELLFKFGISRRWRWCTKSLVRFGGVLFRSILLTVYVRCKLK